jgi:Ricin-type beta-trefoil lectin domain
MHKIKLGGLAVAVAITLGGGMGWSPAALASPAHGHRAAPTSTAADRHAIAAKLATPAVRKALVKEGGIAPACAPVHSTKIASCAVLSAPTSLRHSETVLGPEGYAPADLESAYGEPTLATGNRMTVAIVNPYEDNTAAADLSEYRSFYGMAPCTSGDGCFTQLNQSGTTSPAPAPPAGSSYPVAAATALDMVSAMCPNCHITLVQSNSDAITDLGASVNVAATQDANVIELGWSVSESSAETGYDTTYFNHKGIAIVAASAQNNTLGGDGYGDIGYPAASQYVTAVGGTTLTQDASDSPRGWAETVWPETGSGCSSYEPAPSWQKSVNPCGNGMRALNDLSADAGSPVAVYSGGAWYQQTGNGVAAAIVAGVYALAGPAGSGDYPAAYPYEHPGGSYTTPGNAYNFAEGLNDVTTGYNSSGGCSPDYMCAAGLGYDGPTGLGSPEGNESIGPVDGLNSMIRSVGAANMCMYASPSSSGNAEIEACDLESGQTWTLRADGLLGVDGSTLGDFTECATLESGYTNPPVPITTWNCNDLAINQEWQAEANGEIVNPSSGLCLGDPSGTKSGSDLEAIACDSNAGLVTWIAPFTTPGVNGQVYSQLPPVSGGKPLCMNNLNTTPKNNNPIQAYDCGSTTVGNEWIYEPGSDFRYEDNQSYCTTVVPGSNPVEAGDPVELDTCTDTTPQEWIARSDGSLLSLAGLTIGSTGPAAGVCMQDPNSGPEFTQLTVGICTGAEDVPDTQWTLP